MFVDFKSAFDSVLRESQWKIITAAGIPSKLIRLIGDLNACGTCTVKLQTGVVMAEQVRISDLAYADDIVLLAESVPAAQDFLNRVSLHGRQIGLWINALKTESMVIGDQPTGLTVDQTAIKHVRIFKYMSS